MNSQRVVRLAPRPVKRTPVAAGQIASQETLGRRVESEPAGTRVPASDELRGGVGGAQRILTVDVPRVAGGGDRCGCIGQRRPAHLAVPCAGPNQRTRTLVGSSIYLNRFR